MEEAFERARSLKIPVHQQPERSRENSAVTVTLKPFEYTDWKPLREKLENKVKSVVLALDHIQDPQNLGALIRTAEGLGVDAVLLPKDRSALISPGVYAASVGAVETANVVLVPNLGEGLRQLKKAGFWIVGAAAGENCHDLDETPDFEKVVVVMGSEGDGLSHQIRDLCDWLAQIPMRGKVESLNVSTSGAILLYHFTKRN
jgi:23S rRNA (guanosine2251-2'-O)-methyltransferase